MFNVIITHCYSNRSCPKGVYTAKLSADHAYLVSKSWRIFEPDDCRQYLKNILKNCISVGVFLESDPSQPVSWAFLSSFGYISGSHTLEDYRRNGYNRLVSLHLTEKVLEAKLMPLAAMDVHNIPIINLRDELGYVGTSITLHLIRKSVKEFH